MPYNILYFNDTVHSDILELPPTLLAKYIVLTRRVLFKNVDLNMAKGDKVLVISKDSRATTAFYQILNGYQTQDSGTFDWGITTNQSYLPADNHSFFESDLNLVDWLRQYTKTEEERDEVNIRGFLGKMIFSGEEALKTCKEIGRASCRERV